MMTIRGSIVESAPYSSQTRRKFDMIIGNEEKKTMISEYQKMIAGEVYRPSDPELRALAQASRQKQSAFNKEEDPLKWAEIIKDWFGSTGQNLYINPRLVVNYGVNIHLGENFYSNWNLTMLDVCPIRIGDNAMIGPNCQFLTPLHPLDPQERNSASLLLSEIISGLEEVSLSFLE